MPRHLPDRQDSFVTIITRTRNGLRLSQHGVVISELRTSPGPTHSVFDVLASIISVFAPQNRIGVLGFAGGGMMAPLRALGVRAVIDSVDLDRTGYDLFKKALSGKGRQRELASDRRRCLTAPATRQLRHAHG